jgi:dTDP-glucose 4,6-dehydratase
MKLLVTGGAGFIGSCFVRRRLSTSDDSIVVLDKLTYAGSRASLAACEDDPSMARRLSFVQGDICDPQLVASLLQDCDGVVNFAAESHVDRAIIDADDFLRTNVVGVKVLLDQVHAMAGQRRIRFVQVSTDEVYGDVTTGRSKEDDRLRPRSPYAASKAAAEMLAVAQHATHGTDIVITRGSNTYGPYQHPEKLIPLFITNALDDQPLPLYGDGLQRRDWLYVRDHAGAIEHVLRHGEAGETYNVAGGTELANRDTIELLLTQLDKPWSLVRAVEDRPGHDRRYAMDGSKLRALGWMPRTSFAEGLGETVAWYRANEAWWRAARSGDWDAYYERQYGRRLADAEAAAPGGMRSVAGRG